MALNFKWDFMGKFYSINIQNDFVNFLYVEKKKALYTILEYDTIDLQDFSKFLQKKKPFYLSINVDEAIDDTVTLSTSIKKDTVRRGLIYKKFKDTLTSKQILLNYKKISQDIDDKTTTYKVDAISEVEYVKKLNYIENWLDIKSTTIDKFSLLSLTRKCYDTHDGFGYFSVYTQGKNVTVLAIDHNHNLLFERTSTVTSDTHDTLQFAMVEEINQTIAYVKQQFREAKFLTILLSGSMTLDDTIADNLLLSANLPVAVLYPNSFLKGLKHEEAQHYIMSIGAMFVKKDVQFLPRKIFNLKEYKIALITLMSVAFLTLLVTSTLAYEQYSTYSQDLERYENVKDKLIHLVRTTDTYSQAELEKSYKHLQIAEKFLQHSPSDYLITLKPILDMIHPKKYTYDDKKSEGTTISMIFEKKFRTLSKLSNFEKLFLNKFTLLNKEKNLQYIKKTDYASLTFKARIKNEVKKKTVSAPPPGRRI